MSRGLNRDLVIIESPGKLKTLHGVFDAIGFHASVCATIGHFLENPGTLKDLAIERRAGEFVETKRKPFREDSYRYLCDQIRKCSGRILIATDNDQEGHVIAQDLADLVASLAPSRPVLRMLMCGLDRENIIRALSALHPLDSSKSIPGTARRIADRIIGGCLSDFDRNRPVGRVQSALLGLCADEGLPHTHLRLKMPCIDSGKPFVGELPIFGATTPAELIAALGADTLPAAPIARSEQSAMSAPLAYGDALLGLHRSLDMGVAQAASLLQQMYESGDITYPRTTSRKLTDAGIKSAERMARTRGLIAFKKDLLARADPSAPHEAIRVLNEDRLRNLEIGRPLRLFDNDRDAALAFIARRTLESGMPIQRDYPDLSGAPAWAASVQWKRETPRTVLPWRYPEPPQVVGHAVEAALVATMMEHGVGRPSTYAQHAARFAERGLLDYKYDLTAKGREWLEYAPLALKRPDTSTKMEGLLEREDAPVADLVEQVLEMATSEEASELETIYAKLEAGSPPPDSLESIEDTDRYRPAF